MSIVFDDVYVAQNVNYRIAVSLPGKGIKVELTAYTQLENGKKCLDEMDLDMIKMEKWNNRMADNGYCKILKNKQ